MNSDNKFCANCGEKLSVDAKFCTECGYNFEQDIASSSTQKEAMEPANNHENSEKKTVASNFDFKNLNKKQLGIIGGAIVLIAVVIFMLTGNVSIAGTYESERTIADMDHSELVTISRNGKATLVAEDPDGSGGEITVQLEEFEGYSSEYSPNFGEEVENMSIYRVDPTEDIEIKISMYVDDYGIFDGATEEMEMFAKMFGLAIDRNGNYVTLSGELSSTEAQYMDFDFSWFEFVETTEGLLVNDDLYIKR